MRIASYHFSTHTTNPHSLGKFFPIKCGKLFVISNLMRYGLVGGEGRILVLSNPKMLTEKKNYDHLELFT